MAKVELNIEKFRAEHPQFKAELISDETLTALWHSAEMFAGNDGDSMFGYAPENGIYDREMFLNLILCHLATLHMWPDGQSGRVASASEGSVSTTFETLKTNSYVGQWWSQTKCGALYWSLTAGYRRGGRCYFVRKAHPWG